MPVAGVPTSAGVLDESTMKLYRQKLRGAMEQGSLFYSRNIVDYVMRKEVAVLTSDAHADTRFGAAASILAQSIRSSMCAPLRAREATIGALYVDNVTTPDQFSDGDLQFLGAFANQAAIAIENSRLYAKIEQEAVQRNNFLRFFPPNNHPANPRLRRGPAGGHRNRHHRDLHRHQRLHRDVGPDEAPRAGRSSQRVLPDPGRGGVQARGYPREVHRRRPAGRLGGPRSAIPTTPNRAVRAAVDMQHAIIELNRRWAESTRSTFTSESTPGEPLPATSARSITSSTPPSATTTNVASRICGVAKEGEIVVSAETVDAVTDVSLVFERMEPVMVKGKSEPLQLFKLNWREYGG